MVFVLDKKKTPLMPCTEKRARLLLGRKRAVVARMYPFTVRIKDRIGGNTQPVRLKIDPGSKFTGIAVVRENTPGEVTVLSLFQLEHRGWLISKNLKSRSAYRRRRRSKNLRYRPPRFNNRTRPKGWLAPSLQHRVDTVVSWVSKLRRLAPITGISQELVRFDMQQMQNPEINGVEYQRGTLAGYSQKEYLLAKWGRNCVYCGKGNIPLQVEHIVPKAQGGSNRISNLTLACEKCNLRKGSRNVEDFLAGNPNLLKKIKAQAKAPLKDAAAVNSTRWALYIKLKVTGLPVEVSNGGQTKFNRVTLGIPKSHVLDAVCVGNVLSVQDWDVPTLNIKCTGRGRYGRTLIDMYGFPRSYLMKHKTVHGFQTGDMVRATVAKGKNVGKYTGRIVVRASGSFSMKRDAGLPIDVNYRNCRLVSHGDGYGYSLQQKNVGFVPGSSTV